VEFENADVANRVLLELADYQAWKASSPKPFSLFDYAGCVGTPDLLFAFAKLLCPKLVCHNGHHYIEARFSEDTYLKWKAIGKPDDEIQRVMNHVHVSTPCCRTSPFQMT
jgi:hypothetical protein